MENIMLHLKTLSLWILPLRAPSQRKSQVVLGATQEVNEVIAGLEAQRRTQETKANEAATLLKQAEAFYLEVSQTAAQLQAREQELKVNQERAVAAAIATAKGEIAQMDL